MEPVTNGQQKPRKASSNILRTSFVFIVGVFMGVSGTNLFTNPPILYSDITATISAAKSKVIPSGSPNSRQLIISETPLKTPKEELQVREDDKLLIVRLKDLGISSPVSTEEMYRAIETAGFSFPPAEIIETIRHQEQWKSRTPFCVAVDTSSPGYKPGMNPCVTSQTDIPSSWLAKEKGSGGNFLITSKSRWLILDRGPEM